MRLAEWNSGGEPRQLAKGGMAMVSQAKSVGASNAALQATPLRTPSGRTRPAPEAQRSANGRCR